MNVLPALFHLRPRVTGAVLARARLLTLMLMACLLGWFTLVPLALAGEPDPYVLETTPPGHGGGGLSVGSNLAGYTFRLTQRTQISEVGAQLSIRLGNPDGLHRAVSRRHPHLGTECAE